MYQESSDSCEKDGIEFAMELGQKEACVTFVSDEMFYNSFLIDKVVMKGQNGSHVISLHSRGVYSSFFKNCFHALWDACIIQHLLHSSCPHSVTHEWLLPAWRSFMRLAFSASSAYAL